LSKQKHLIVVCGPTASGKTSLAIQLAKKHNTEIISADSRQFYKEISIGTAKPAPTELNQAKHHFIGNLSIQQDYNAGQYEVDALKCIYEIHTKSDYAIMVGGSGLYIDAVCKGFDKLPERDEKLRAELEQKNLDELQSHIKQLDPVYCETADLQNKQRLIRAIEVCLTSELAYSQQQKAEPKIRPFKINKLAIDWNREELYSRINKRVDSMFEEGLLEEAKSVYEFKHLNSLQTVGYSELFDYFDGIHNLETAIELIKRNSRRYAKRQLTWLRRDDSVTWIKPTKIKSM
jgi:tRNA dimethylallyltransferase